MSKSRSKKTGNPSNSEYPMLKIADIRRDGGTQAREGIKQKTINEYAMAIRDGVTFPAVTVFNDGESLWLADGFHRVGAALSAGLEEIAADVREGNIHDAKWFAMAANKVHGERMTNADKRHAVLMALEDEELSSRSDREIAIQCQVSNHLVSNMRREITESVNGSHIDQSSPKEEVSNSNTLEIERLQKELANREEFEKQREAELEATIAERVQEELAKHHDQPSDEELERLRQEITSREEAERQLREEMEALKNSPSPDIEAAVTERLQEELAKRPEQSTDEEIERLRTAKQEREAEARQLREELEALKNAPPPDIEATIAERVQEELAKRPEQPSDEEIERLRQELAERDRANQEREEKARQLENEMQSLKNGEHPDIEAIIEERVQKAIEQSDQHEESERVRSADQERAKAEALLNEQREQHAEELRKLQEELETLRNAEPEIVEKEVPSQELEDALRQKELEHIDLQTQLDAKIREIEEAKNAGMEISELSGQKDGLVAEITNLKNDLAETYRENARTKFRDVGSSVDSILRATEFLSEKASTPEFCMLIVDEIVNFREDMERTKTAADAAMEVSDQLLFQLRNEGNTEIPANT